MTGASPPCFSSDATSICSSSSSTSTSSSMTDDVSSRAFVTRSRDEALEMLSPCGCSCACCWRLPPPPLAGVGSRVVPLDRLHDRGLGGHHRLDVVARHELDVVHGEHVRRVGHRDRQGRPRATERHDLILVGRVGRHELDDGGVDVELRQVDGGNAVLLAEELGNLLVLHEPQLDQVVAQLAAVRLLRVECFLELRRRNALLLQQKFTDADSHSLVRVWSRDSEPWRELRGEPAGEVIIVQV